MFRPINWSSSGPSQIYIESQKAARTYGIPLVLTNTNGVLYVCAAFYDSVSLCDGPDDDHLMGRNMLSIWHFYGNKSVNKH